MPGSSRVDILIVEDDRDLMEAIRDVLSDAGYTLASAADGLEALEYLASSARPALILLDWMMPRCDGAAFRERQRADPAIADIPVVLLTADMRVGERAARLELAAILKKPIDVDALLALVEKLCRA